ncbi:MAG: hypothetical protein KME16_09230 [Scytolyngbya sp. HA4215-MV1]|jgi:hypothetical protein|nr:hypothetical protein [Scytolyngbya sp. HA4215-MV1]
MTSPNQPFLSSTLGELPLCRCWINSTDPGQLVESLFEQEPDLPGVIIMEDTRLLGVVSRRRFYECLGKGFGQEIFLKRSIQVFLNQMSGGRFLQLAFTDSVQQAMQMALSRSLEDWYEPIVVVAPGQEPPTTQQFFLLGFDSLLLAQFEILTIANWEIQQQALTLAEERQKSHESAQLLEKQQLLIQERNQLLERNQAELLRRSQQLNQLNQRFCKIGHLLSVEGKKAFQATFESANAICRNMGLIVNNGRLLHEELDTVRTTSKLIEKVSQQVRHLAIQAAIVANQDGTKMTGFSYITEEIRKLGTRTFEAGRQMESIASRLESRIQELTDSAQTGTSVARSLIGKIESAQIALTELEKLVQIEASGVLESASSDKKIANGTSEIAPSFVQRIELLEDTLYELKELAKQKDSKVIPGENQPILNPNQSAING